MPDFVGCPKCAKEGLRIILSEGDNGLVCPLCDSS